MNATLNIVHQDRRGLFHSCDRETYRKLRKVRHFLHWQRIQQNRHRRWSAKLPHNRVRWVFNGYSNGHATWKSEPWNEPKLCPINLTPLYEDYLRAKGGKEKLEDVVPLLLSSDAIDAMIQTCESWLASIR